MSAAIQNVFKMLWGDYTDLNPRLLALEKKIEERGDVIINDHVAFRTFDDSRINVESMGRIFTQLGYAAMDFYEFDAKKLKARYFEPPEAGQPKVFISELMVSKLSNWAQKKIAGLLDAVHVGSALSPEFLVSGRPWEPVSYADYNQLKEESEYAAWMSVFGFRVNHFTISINALKTFEGLPDFNMFMKSCGYILNTQGGEIKGSPGLGLEQSSTMASQIPCEFSDGTYSIPACYYEFALRHPVDGGLFPGFLPESADKIFESTDHKRK